MAKCNLVRDPKNSTSKKAKKDKALNHNRRLSLKWSEEEQLTLEKGLATFASYSGIALYAKIATMMPKKTIRDVAMRMKWMAKKVINVAVKSPDAAAAQTNILPCPSEELPMDNNDDISLNEIGGTAGVLLMQNRHALDLINGHLACFESLNLLQMHDIMKLFSQVRDNINQVLNDTDIMALPSLPVCLDEKTANYVFEKTNEHINVFAGLYPQEVHPTFNTAQNEERN